MQRSGDYPRRHHERFQAQTLLRPDSFAIKGPPTGAGLATPNAFTTNANATAASRRLHPLQHSTEPTNHANDWLASNKSHPTTLSYGEESMQVSSQCHGGLAECGDMQQKDQT
mgnify:CR=1 FL=1